MPISRLSHVGVCGPQESGRETVLEPSQIRPLLRPLPPNDFGILLRSTMPTRGVSCKASEPDPSAHPVSSNSLLGGSVRHFAELVCVEIDNAVIREFTDGESGHSALD